MNQIKTGTPPGRNAPCPCGSGRKYKRCHGILNSGSIPLPRAVEAVLEEIRKQQLRREAFHAQYGLGKPIIHANFEGMKLVAVGNELHFVNEDKCRYFPDFLGAYLKTVLTREWWESEVAKSLLERHQILKWADSCGFRPMPATGSGACRATIPEHAGIGSDAG